MPGLERNSHCRWVRPAAQGRERHAAGDFLPRHVHEEAFATIVLTGGYVEAGDTGRHRAEPGDALIHAPYEFHLDRFERRSTELLVVPVKAGRFSCAAGRVPDLDAIVRILEGDPAAAEDAIGERLEPKPAALPDWPDILAHDLSNDPALSLAEWADNHRLAAGSVSRGFGQVYGVTPAAYRLLQRTHRAIRAILGSEAPLAALAQNCGFADQAHMVRSVRHATGLTPRALRLRERQRNPSPDMK
ncbi:MAG TPA: AraC family transcriptional regulator [Steroidobacteraceae bacterium]|nr:AraC family transcriptional regulator [Steroidobacteraceae bacterium]